MGTLTEKGSCQLGIYLKNLQWKKHGRFQSGGFLSTSASSRYQTEMANLLQRFTRNNVANILPFLYLRKQAQTQLSFRHAPIA